MIHLNTWQFFYYIILLTFNSCELYIHKIMDIVHGRLTAILCFARAKPQHSFIIYLFLIKNSLNVYGFF